MDGIELTKKRTVSLVSLLESPPGMVKCYSFKMHFASKCLGANETEVALELIIGTSEVCNFCISFTSVQD